MRVEAERGADASLLRFQVHEDRKGDVVTDEEEEDCVCGQVDAADEVRASKSRMHARSVCVIRVQIVQHEAVESLRDCDSWHARVSICTFVPVSVFAILRDCD